MKKLGGPSEFVVFGCISWIAACAELYTDPAPKILIVSTSASSIESSYHLNLVSLTSNILNRFIFDFSFPIHIKAKCHRPSRTAESPRTNRHCGVPQRDRQVSPTKKVKNISVSLQCIHFAYSTFNESDDICLTHIRKPTTPPSWTHQCPLNRAIQINLRANDLWTIQVENFYI